MNVDETRLAVACECLRQLWQNLDAGGRSMGRSRDAVWLETAMLLLPYDNRYSDMADTKPKAFDDIRAEVHYLAQKEQVDQHFREMGLE